MSAGHKFYTSRISQ